MFLVVDNERKKQLDWIQTILEARRWSQNRLANTAGVDASGINRFINDPEGKRTLNLSTVEKIERASGIPAYSTDASQVVRIRPGFSQGDGVPYDPRANTDIDLAANAIKRGRNGVDPWVMESNSLELRGIAPGDVVMVDLNTMPKRGEIAVAQIYDAAGGARTVFRIFSEPFLYGATRDLELMEPILIDKNVVIRGKVLTAIKPLAAA